jgi:hypothetical protein
MTYKNYQTLEEAIRQMPVPYGVKIEDVLTSRKTDIEKKVEESGKNYGFRSEQFIFWDSVSTLHHVAQLVGDKKIPFRSYRSHLGYYVGGIHNAAKQRIRAAEKRAKNKAKETDADWSEPSNMIIPTFGTILKLTEDWEFRLHSERRNRPVMDLYGMDYGDDTFNVVLPAGTVLKVSRIYIRGNTEKSREYDSITFNIQDAPEELHLIDALSGKDTALRKGKSKRKPQFWAKLSDVNKMKVVVNKNTMAQN